MTDYTLTVPENVYRRAEQMARATAQPVEAVLLDHLRLLADAAPLLAEDEEAELQALRYLSDDALWTIAREQMASEAQARMRTLMDKNSSSAITPEEHHELARLVVRGQQLMLRKSEAAAVLTRRGYTVSAQGLAARLP
jgi:hypothetical protein